MTKKSMDYVSQSQQNSVKIKWKGHPLNNSDIGYDDEWEDTILSDTTGPFNPNEEVNENITED